MKSFFDAKYRCTQGSGGGRRGEKREHSTPSNMYINLLIKMQRNLQKDIHIIIAITKTAVQDRTSRKEG
jgi:hypothetical protein